MDRANVSPGGLVMAALQQEVLTSAVRPKAAMVPYCSEGWGPAWDREELVDYIWGGGGGGIQGEWKHWFVGKALSIYRKILWLVLVLSLTAHVFLLESSTSSWGGHWRSYEGTTNNNICEADIRKLRLVRGNASYIKSTLYSEEIVSSSATFPEHSSLIIKITKRQQRTNSADLQKRTSFHVN